MVQWPWLSGQYAVLVRKPSKYEHEFTLITTKPTITFQESTDQRGKKSHFKLFFIQGMKQTSFLQSSIGRCIEIIWFVVIVSKYYFNHWWNRWSQHFFSREPLSNYMYCQCTCTVPICNVYTFAFSDGFPLKGMRANHSFREGFHNVLKVSVVFIWNFP
jgi:hypothetical protein